MATKSGTGPGHGEGLGLRPTSLPLRLFPSDFFKRNNRKVQHWGGGGRWELGVVVAGQGRASSGQWGTMPQAVVSSLCMGFQFPESPEGWRWGSWGTVGGGQAAASAGRRGGPGLTKSLQDQEPACGAHPRHCPLPHQTASRLQASAWWPLSQHTVPP